MPDTRLPELKDEASRQALSEAITDVLTRWHVNEANQAALLGVDDVNFLRKGQALPEDPRVLERAGLLFAIFRALKRRYPYQPTERARWINEIDARLGGKTPLEIMLADELQGIKRVRALLGGDGQ